MMKIRNPRKFHATKISCFTVTGVFNRVLIFSPRSDYSPAAIEDHGRVDNEADTESLRVIFTQQPDEVLHKLVVHVGHCEIAEIEHYAQIVHHILVTLRAPLLLQIEILFSLYAFISMKIDQSLDIIMNMGYKSISGNPGKTRPLISVIPSNDWFPQLTVTYIHYNTRVDHKYI